LNYGIVKDAQSRSVHLQYLFFDCNRAIIFQAPGQSRNRITHYRNGVFSFRCFKYHCECDADLLQPEKKSDHRDNEDAEDREW
jgi:hypothetical protein